METGVKYKPSQVSMKLEWGACWSSYWSKSDARPACTSFHTYCARSNIFNKVCCTRLDCVGRYRIILPCVEFPRYLKNPTCEIFTSWFKCLQLHLYRIKNNRKVTTTKNVSLPKVYNGFKWQICDGPKAKSSSYDILYCACHRRHTLPKIYKMLSFEQIVFPVTNIKLCILICFFFDFSGDDNWTSTGFIKHPCDCSHGNFYDCCCDLRRIHNTVFKMAARTQC